MIHDAAEGLPSCYFEALEKEQMIIGWVSRFQRAHGGLGKRPWVLPRFTSYLH